MDQKTSQTQGDLSGKAQSSLPDELSGGYSSYLWLLFLIIFTIFLAEMVAMFVIRQLPLSIPYLYLTLIDAGIMVALIFPILYYFSFRPLLLQINKRQQAEKAAQAERQHLLDILETLPGYLALLTPDYHVSFANRIFRERFGEANGRRCYEYLFGRDEPCEICETYQVLKTRQSGRWEWTGPDHRIYDVYDFPFTDTDGSTAILEMGIDITDQKQAETQIREMAFFPALNPDGVLQVDATGQIRKINPAAARMGFAVGTYLTDVIPDLRELDLPACITAGVTQHIQKEAHLGDKILLWSARGAPDLGLAFLYSKDITLYRRAEETVRQLSRIVQQTEDTVVVTNRDGVIEYVNPSFERLTGYTKEEALGQTPRVIKSNLYEKDYYQNLWNTILAGEIYQNEIANRKKNGELYYEMKTITPLRDAQGNITHFVATGKDITEHKLDEEKLRKAYDELELRVELRTEELRKANSELAQEIIERKRVEEILRKANERLQDQAEELDVQAEELRLQTEELRETNEQLSKNESTLQSILNATQESVWLFDTNGIVLLANKTALSRMQIPANQIIGRHFDMYMPAEVAQRRQAYLDQVVNTGQPVEFEDQRAGIIFYHTFYPVRDSSGHVTGVAAFSRDITESKQAEETLRESEQHLKRAQEIAHLGSWELDLERDCLSWSDEVYRIFGLQSQEFGATYEAFLEAVHPDDRVAVDAAYSSSIREGRDQYEIEHRIIRRLSGEIRIVHEKCEHFRNEAGQIIRSMGMVHDITERKQVEEQIRYQATLLSNVNDAIVASDPQYRVTAWNSSAESLYGWKAEEVLGRNGVEFIQTEWRENDADEMRRVIAETGRWRGEASQIRKDGTRFPVEISSMVLRDQRGQITGYLSVNRDITARKQAEEQIERSNQKLNEILASIQDDFYVLDHDWNFVYVSKLFTSKIGKAPEDFIGSNLWKMFPKHVGTDLEKNFRIAMEKREIRRFEIGGKYTNAWYRMTAFPSAEGITVLGTDITERKQAQEREQQFNRTLKALNHSNQAMMRSRSETELLDEVCKIIVEDCGHAMVWIGFKEEDEQKSVRPVASAGFEAGYLETLQISWSDTERGHGPTGTAVRTGESRRCRNMLTDPQFAPWREQALTRGYASSIALPLKMQESILGAITIYSHQPDSFAEEEERLLTELAGDLAYGITALRLRTARTEAEEALRRAHDELELRVQERTQELVKEITERKEVEKQLRVRTTAMEAAANGIIITDPQGCIEWTNPALLQITGYESHELVGQGMRIFNSGTQSIDYYQQMWNTILSGQVWRGEVTNRRKDGSLYPEEQTITPVRDENDRIHHFIAIKQDITERKRAEAEMAEWNIKLQTLSIAEREQRQLSESLAEAALVLNKSMKLEEVLPMILEQVKTVIPYQLSIIMMFDGEWFYDACHAGDQRWAENLAQVRNRFPLDDFPLLGKMRQSHQPVVIADTQKETNWMIVHGLEWSRSILCVPLLAENQVIGFLNLLAEQPYFFTTQMRDQLVAFAAHAAIAIQNAWLFEQVRASNERLQSLSRRLVEIQENERLYIARELHDEAGQMLTSLMLNLVTLEAQANQPEAVLKKTAEMEEILNAVSENLHNVAMALRPASLDHLGLVPALRQYVESVGERYRLKASFTAGNFQERLPANIETELYRIVQEALTNVARHAHASQVDVILTRRNHKLIVMIEDDGKGFDPENVPATGHLGLFGMRERAEMIGGQLIIESKPGRGTTVIVEVDYDSPIVDRG